MENAEKPQRSNYSTISIYPQPQEVLTDVDTELRKNITEGSYKNVRHYLDIHFQLLREDFMAPLRRAISAYKDSLESTTSVHIPEFRVYLNATFVTWEQYYKDNLTSLKAAKFSAEYIGNRVNREMFKLLLPGACQQTVAEGEECLKYGTLLCFSSDNFKTMFFGIATKLHTTVEGFADVHLLENVPFLHQEPYTMLECTNYFHVYKVVLRALQNFSTFKFPMQEYIVDVDKAIKPPAYLSPALKFTLGDVEFKVADFQTWPSKEQLHLNAAQYQAFRNALTSKFAIIQGPPGTGKTYVSVKIAEAFIKNYEALKRATMGSGPILVVAYSNHALDQFLEALIPFTSNIIRVGRRSTNTNVKKLVYTGCKRDGAALAEYYKCMEDILQESKVILEKLEDVLSSNRIFDAIRQFASKQNSWFNDVSCDEFVLWLMGESSTEEQRENRWHMAKQILTKPEATNLKYIKGLEKKSDDERYLREHKQVQDGRIIASKAVVVGMTTTGAAQKQHLLAQLRCPIVIVEEAAEVLESHIIVSLTRHCEHLILVGDHQQLRPTTSDHKMGTKYHLGISLFERMVRNHMHCSTLEVQHRMRPEISRLIVPAIYPNLKNHQSVHLLPSVVGVKHDVFFIHHNHAESTAGKSRKNAHEAQYVLALALHLIRQGYDPSNITILATYRGQVDEIKGKQEVENDLVKSVRVTTVDSFQGEENKIILLSLVRNNDDNSIGFLSIENRVCVALSRARLGLYMIGNMDILCRNSALWPKIQKVLKSNGQLGRGLSIYCRKHPKDTARAVDPEDFEDVLCGKMQREE